MIRGSGCSKSRLAKAVGAEVAVEHRNEKWHAAVARSTFVSQNVEKFRVARAFWKIRSGKIAWRSGAKHISKSKCARHLSLGRIVEVQICKNATLLRREAHS